MFRLILGASSCYTVLGVTPTVSAPELLEARSKLQTSIRQKMRTAEGEGKAELEERLKAINAAGEALCRPEKRKEYDQTNAHLHFFIDRSAAASIFQDRFERFFMLHRTLRAHLVVHGEVVAPLCDLDHDDFSSDESPNRLLDDLLGKQ